MSYTVLVAENSHYMDESETYRHGDFDDGASAVAACKKIVEEFLAENYKPGRTARELFELYTMFGEDPHIISSSSDPECKFSAWDYARERVKEMCGE